MLGAGAVVLSVGVMREQLFAESAAGATDAGSAMAKAPLQPSVYLAIDTDGTAYVVVHRTEMGSGNRTGLPRIWADELDADWGRGNAGRATGEEKDGDREREG